MSERRPKKRPNVFAQVVANADEVVQASFIAAAPTSSSAEAPSAEATSRTPPVELPPAPVAEVFMPPGPPVADGAPDTASVPAQAPEPARPAAAPPTTSAGESVEREAVLEPLASPPSMPPPKTAAEERPPAPVTAWPEPVQPADLLPAPASHDAGDERQTSAPAGVRLPEPEAAPRAQPRRRAVASVRRGGQQHWSHQAVFESFASATIESKNWRLHGFRIVPDVLALLKTRINADRRSTGNAKLAISHYLDAALRHASTDVDEQVALAQEFLTVRMGMVEAGKQSTYRVGPQASAWVADLNVGLQEADYGRKGIYVVSASIEAFLSALDDAGSLQRPELPGVR